MNGDAAKGRSIEAEDWVARLRATCGHYYGEPRPGQRRVRGDVRASVVRGLEIAELSGDLARIDRTPAGIRADALEHVFLLAPRRGTLDVEHGGRRTSLAPGRVLLLDSTRPARLSAGDAGVDFVSVHLPRHEFMARCRVPPRCGEVLVTDPGAGSGAGVGTGGGASGGAVVRRGADGRGADGGPGTAAALGAALADLLRSTGTATASPGLVHELVRMAFAGGGSGVGGAGGRPGGRLDAGELPDAATRTELAELLIERHLEHETLSLAWLARAVGLSPRQLQRDLAGRGLSFARLVRRKRVALAAASLRRARRDGVRVRISDVALDAGFRDLSNFNRAFRACTGASPREFLSDDCPGHHGPGRGSGDGP